MIKGQVISGEVGKILVRQKSSESIELGELLVADAGKDKILLQAYDLIYGSQISQQNLELISGLNLEEDDSMDFFDPKLRNYKLAFLKNIITISGNDSRVCKSLPDFFSEVREVTKEDLGFLARPDKPLFLGKLRSGSRLLDVDAFLDGEKVLAHHILIPATTGRGKSNLASCLLWDTLDKDYCAMLVLDPHDEYYGREGLGLKDHPSKKPVYYTPKAAPPGGRTLVINLSLLKPQHFNGVVEWSPPQRDAMTLYRKKYGNDWIEAMILEKPIEADLYEGTLGVVRRKLLTILDLEFSGNQLYCNGSFSLNAGETTISDIAEELEKGNTVIVDTSNYAGAVEILIGSIITNELLLRYKMHKMKGILEQKPVVSIVLEEAPRVLGKEVLEKGPNVFSTIAREGRKFKVGLTAITQLPSLIPRQILANMNTKIILGTEMAPERQAIIESAAQDLSADNRNIASLDRGEAIVSSNFSPFAVPVKIPLFSDFAKTGNNAGSTKTDFSGINLG